MTEKIKLMYLGDLSNTGFGTVSAGLLSNLHRTGRYDILHVAINHNDLNPSPVPWKTISSGFWHLAQGGWIQDDPYGVLKVQRYIEWFDPDVFMLNNDFPIADKYWKDDEGDTPFALHRSKKILYAPLDSEPCPPFFADSALKWDMVIMYTHWQKKLMEARNERYADSPVLYHGYDPSVFKPMDKQEAKDRLGEILRDKNPKATLPDFTKKYIVYFNGTNQWRKDVPALFKAFADFKKKVKNALLLPHTNISPQPGSGGWYLPNLAGLYQVSEVVLMNNANVFSPEEVNIFYNASDMMAYPTRGEGFGLPSFEAMATKTPAIVTRFGPQVELHENGRGWFIRTQDMVAAPNHGWTEFALPDWKDLARQMYHVYANPDEVKAVTDRAYAWVQRFPWSNQAAQLDSIIQKMIGEEVA